MKIGEIIRGARIKKGIGVEELAQKIDRSPSAIYDMEKYSKMPNFDTACMICEVLDIDVNYLWSSIRDEYLLKVKNNELLVNNQAKKEKKIQRGDG